MMEPIRLDVGGGRNPAPGFTVLDIENMPTVDIVAPAWRIPLTEKAVCEIRARHFLEHLTLRDARRTLREWWRVLTDDGFATITVPDLIYHVQQILQPGKSEFLPGRTNYEHAFSSIYGWQEMGETMGHRYGYTRDSLPALLVKAGFKAVLQKSRACDIVVIARKV